ncbi:nitroreductase family protein [Candidatus Bathyarchaeota archaeon]|nr:nitroreductase family protein [Candidatus Bathyarchaeota archaeon]
MEIPECILRRKSVRNFLEKEISDQDIEIILKSAILAPSAGNLQPWNFIVIKDTATKLKLSEAASNQKSIIMSSVVFAICVEPSRSATRYGERGTNLYCFQDTAAAIMNIILTAAHNGLGSCWIGAFNEEMASKILELPQGIRPIALLPVGYPSETPSQRPRRPLNEVVHKEKW